MSVLKPVLPERKPLRYPVETTPLAADQPISRIINGLWQVAGSHGTIMAPKALREMIRYHEGGFTTWDAADNYGPAEDFIGALRRQLAREQSKEAAQTVQALTKWAPRPGLMDSRTVAAAIDQSRRRMGTHCLDLLQFHWWDYSDDRYLDALKHLADLQAAGKIQHLGLTNFDTAHLQIVIDAGIPIVTNQVQFSIIDQRPLAQMVPLCQQHGIQLLAYGTLCGGLLSERPIGLPNPGPLLLNTASLRKYKTMITSWGGWALFQELLLVLQAIATKHQVSIANVALRYVLDQPTVASAIVGVRLGIAEHLANNAQVFNLKLDRADLEQIYSLCDRSEDLIRVIGDCGDEYRQ
jgi:aryl-alcohol dehydrogenase-like predicted oxidoreductase